MRGVFELILALFRALECHVEGSLGRFGSLFWDQNGAKNDTKKGPEFGPDFGTKHVRKQAPKMDPKMVPKRLLGKILASSRPSWALLGHQQASFESSGSTMIARSLSRGLLGGFLGPFKTIWGLYLELFGSIQCLSWATWTSYGFC